MNLVSSNQTILLGHKKEFMSLVNLYSNNNFPNKILFSGEKGIGKSTLAYHLVNYILSLDEDNPYNLEKLEINIDNKSFKLTQNKSNPNFTLIDVTEDKKYINIEQIRNLILSLNKSSFNTKPRFILIDNIELLNTNSVNALLKIVEEPNDNIFFILINNNKKVLTTLKSRCLNFKFFLPHHQSIEIINDRVPGFSIDPESFSLTEIESESTHNYGDSELEIKRFEVKREGFDTPLASVLIVGFSSAGGELTLLTISKSLLSNQDDVFEEKIVLQFLEQKV